VPVVNRCFKSQTLMRVPQVGSAEAPPRSAGGTCPGQGSPGNVCVLTLDGAVRVRSGPALREVEGLRVVPGTSCTHERGDGNNLSTDGGGWVEFTLHSPASDG